MKNLLKIHFEIIIIILLIISFVGNFILYNKSKKLDYDILIGIPVMGRGEYTTIGTNFTKSKPLSDKSEASNLIFSLMKATNIKKPEICNELPNASIQFYDCENNISYYDINIWITEDYIIIENENKYKKIDNKYDITNLTKIIDKELNNYK